MQRVVLAAALLSLSLGAGLMAQRQASPYSAPVTLYASVTDKTGAFVRDLSATDFTLKEAGQNRIIEAAAVDESPATVILLIDTSGSMRSQGERMNALLTVFLNRLHPADRLRVGRADGKGEFTPGSFSTNRREAAATISAWGPGLGASPLWDSLRSALDVLAAEPGYRAVVVLSDGEDTASKIKNSDVTRAAQTLRVAVHALETPITSFVVNGKPTNYRKADLENVARDTGGLHRRVPKVEDRQAIDDISSAVRERYRITFSPGASSGKLHEIELRARTKDLTVRVASRYGGQ